jgi:ubiquinone/menaquinone biosynthesis C-methylase UbiE
VNSPTFDESAPSLAADGTLFFARQESTAAHGPPGHGTAQIDIYYSEWRNGAYAEPVRMGPEINSEYPETDPVIAPDKSYLLFTSARPDGYSRMMNLYVSFRTADGRWTPAQSLSHTLKVDNIWFPSLSADGDYLFFCGGYPTGKGYTDSQYYWVDAKIIDSLRPSMGRPGQQLEINQEEKNGNELQPPDKVMDAAGVRAGMVIGEVGAGKGRYTVYLARRVGSEGKVYANDIDEKSLAFLKGRCQKQGFGNVETVLGTTDDPRFPKGKLDIVFMTWVYHHLENPVALLRNLIPGLKPGGTVVIVDPDPIKNRGGRSPENRSPDQIRREAGEAGFEVVRVETFLKLDNLYVLEVRSSPNKIVAPID